MPKQKKKYSLMKLRKWRRYSLLCPLFGEKRAGKLEEVS